MVDRKFIESIDIDDYQVLTDEGFEDIKAIHKTIPYEVFELLLYNKDSEFLNTTILHCADTHIVFDEDYNEIYVKDLIENQEIIVKNEDSDSELTCKFNVIYVKSLGIKKNMFDLELNENSNHRYYTNGILSHNTYICKVLSELLFNSDDDLVRINMSEYGEKFNVSRLIGSPSGYVGYEQGGQLTEKIRRKPYSLILFDEIEKAHPDVFDIFLQMLDTGILTDGLGRDISFKNCIICFTSNCGTREINEFGGGIGFESNTEQSDSERRNSIVQKSLKKKFKPEFLNRIDNIIVFNNLTQENINIIALNELNKLGDRLKEIGYKELKFDKSIVDYMAEIGFDKEYGARPLNRAIAENVEDNLCEVILNDEIKKELTIKISYDKKNQKVIIKNK